MESIQKFCGLNFNESFSVWEKEYRAFSTCFLWNVLSDPVHCLFIISCAYLFGISSKKTRTKAKGCISCLTEFLCITTASCCLVEVILSYVLKQTHPPAYVLSKMLALASWMMCFSLLFSCKRNLQQYKQNNKYVLFFSILILASSSIQMFTVVKTISNSGNLNLVRWPILYYGVFAYFFLNVCFVLSSIGIQFCLRQDQASFNRSIPSLTRNSTSIQDYDSSDYVKSLVDSGSESQGSYCEEYQRHKERHTDIYLGKAENTKNIFSRLLFWWCNKLILKGYHRQLNTTEDLFILPNSLDTRIIKERFSGMLRIQRHNTVFRELKTECITEYENPRRKKPVFVSLLKTLNKAFGSFYYTLGVLKFIIDCLGFAGPLLLNFLVSFMENRKEPMVHGYYYALGLFLSTFSSILLSAQYRYYILKVGMQIRAALITAIYEKTLSTSTSTLSEFNTGQVVNYMSTDTDRVVNFTRSFHEFWSLPFQVAVCLYLLYQQLGVSFLAGLGVILLLIPINRKIAQKIGGLSKKMMKQKDERVKIISEILFGIRIIKLYAWEKHFKKKVEEARNGELSSLKGRKYLDALCVFFWATTSIWISISTFTTYVLLGNQLDAAKVFTSIALFNILIPPINAFPWVINGLVEAWVSLKRIERFLTLTEINLGEYYVKTSNDDGDRTVFEVEEATFSWKQINEGEGVSSNTNVHFQNDEETNNGSKNEGESGTTRPFMLKDISMFIQKGQLLGISGKVGSGKSSLFAALTAEMHKDNGYIYLGDEFSGFAYVAQEAWIQHMTIKDNILFGKPFNHERYEEVLYACALKEDLNQLPAGDLTEVGENGVTLSGGQKARISLARAAYQDKDVYLLDDPLSAVDAHVAAHLFDNCIMGLLRNKTRLLATHHIKYLWKTDSVVLFVDGKIVASGDPEEVLTQQDFSKKDNQQVFDVITQEEPFVDENIKQSLDDDLSKGKLVEDEKMEKGVVAGHVYLAYWKAVGKLLAPIIILFVALMTGSKYFGDWWLAYWISNTQVQDKSKVYSLYSSSLDLSSGSISSEVRHYLTIYGIIAASNSVLAFFRAFLFAYGGIQAAKYFHDKLLKAILEAPIYFFDVTPIGRIINRFSSDTYSVDDSLPFITNIVLAQASAVLGTIIITCYGLPWFIAVLVPLSAIYYYTQHYYRRTSREIKRLCSVTLSPVYEHFSETLSGLMTIRAFQEPTRFAEENERKLDFNQRANYSGLVASQWLLLRLNFIGVVMVTAVAFLAVFEHHYKSVNPGLVGLAISYALSITGLLNGLVTFFTETEKEMVSVERMLEYIEKTPKEEEGTYHIDHYWPPQGAVCFRNVYLKYRESLPFALHNVSFFVKAGEKIGICGRTGSGKSSLFRLLFKTVGVTDGEIIVDGVNLKHVHVRQARCQMSIIPQDPFLFNDSVLNNLDPKNKYSTFDLHEVVEKCYLTKLVQDLGGFEGNVGERGSNLSAGQKQLMCLARALLKRSKVICIDEATASVDFETDKLIQETIRKEFAASTVLTIAHRDADTELLFNQPRDSNTVIVLDNYILLKSLQRRIETIMDCDRVLVMNAGRVIEFAPPRDLLSDHESLFFSLVHENNRQ